MRVLRGKSADFDTGPVNPGWNLDHWPTLVGSMLLQIQVVRREIVRDYSTCGGNFRSTSPAYKQAAKKNASICHSEPAPASEESLFARNAKKKRVPGAQRA